MGSPTRVWAAAVICAAAFAGGCVDETHFVAASQERVELRVHGSTTTGPAMVDLAREFMELHPHVAVRWPCAQTLQRGAPASRYDAEVADTPVWRDWLGSEWTPRLLVAGEIDVGGMSRQMKADEMERSRGNGAPLRAYRIAADALVLICHPSRGPALRGITREQAAGVFLTGDITHWDQLDPALEHAEIVPWSRNPLDSGTGNAFVELTDRARARNFDGTDQYASHVRFGGPDEINDAVARDRNAIGYNSFGRIGSAAVRKLAYADGVANRQPVYVQPELAQFLSGVYALQRPLFLVAKGTPSGEVNRFIRFVLSPRGQAILRAHEFVTMR
jgi:phosphate transport system substrate-binding protein